MHSVEQSHRFSTIASQNKGGTVCNKLLGKFFKRLHFTRGGLIKQFIHTFQSHNQVRATLIDFASDGARSLQSIALGFPRRATEATPRVICQCAL